MSLLENWIKQKFDITLAKSNTSLHMTSLLGLSPPPKGSITEGQFRQLASLYESYRASIEERLSSGVDLDSVDQEVPESITSQAQTLLAYFKG